MKLHNATVACVNSEAIVRSVQVLEIKIKNNLDVAADDVEVAAVFAAVDADYLESHVKVTWQEVHSATVLMF